MNAPPSEPGAPEGFSSALHLVRHGQSTWNVLRKVQGQNDESELTALGLEQAAAVARTVAQFSAVRLLASDLRRAVQTAEIIGAATGLTPFRTSLLREQGLGVLEGLDSAAAAQEWEKAAQRAFDEYGEPVPATAIRVPGGESMRDVLGRVGGILASPLVTDAGGDVVIVSHGDTIRIMLALLLGDDFDEMQWRPVGNAEVHSVYRRAGGAVDYRVTATPGLRRITWWDVTVRNRVVVEGLRLAVGTLTAFPVGAPQRVDASTARVAMLIAPFAVLPVAATAAAVGELGRLVLLGPLVIAALVVGTFALGSRGLHLDGLADTADGLTASYDRDRALEIMRRGNTGPAGAATLVLVLLLQTAALATVLARPWGLLVGVLALVLSRSSLLVTCTAGLPAARPGGLGATVAGVVPRSVAVVAGLPVAVLASAAGVLSGRPWWQGPLSVAMAALVVVVLVLRCRKRFGGITGDVLGAGIELAATALLVGLAAGR